MKNEDIKQRKTSLFLTKLFTINDFFSVFLCHCFNDATSNFSTTYLSFLQLLQTFSYEPMFVVSIIYH